MRAPIGFRISNRRKSLKISQAALARLVGISPSYLNLIENNKRDIGGALLNRVAAQLDIDIDELAGHAEQKLLQDLEEAFADPMVESLPFRPDERRELVAQYPASGAALARLHRAYSSAINNADAYADRLRSDPLLSQLLHQILSGITAIRSSAEILEDVPDLDEAERRQFLAAIGRETRALSDVTRNLIGQFETSSRNRSSVSPAREIDDLIIAQDNHFPELERVADALRQEIDRAGPFGITTLTDLLAGKFGVGVTVGGAPPDIDLLVGGDQFHPDTVVDLPDIADMLGDECGGPCARRNPHDALADIAVAPARNGAHGILHILGMTQQLASGCRQLVAGLAADEERFPDLMLERRHPPPQRRGAEAGRMRGGAQPAQPRNVEKEPKVVPGQGISLTHFSFLK